MSTDNLFMDLELNPDESEALIDLGLALDHLNEDKKTDKKILDWLVSHQDVLQNIAEALIRAENVPYVCPICDEDIDL